MTNPNTGVPLENLESHGHSTNAKVHAKCEAMEEGCSFVHANPLPFILGAFGVGIAIALLFPRPQRSQRERYVEDPLDELKELLRGTGRRLTHSADETRDGTVSALHEALKKVKSSMPAVFKS